MPVYHLIAISIFSAYQFLHRQKRFVSHHVEFESTDWMIAFNGISGLFDYFVNCFESLDSIESPMSPITVSPLSTVFEHVLMVLNALLKWQSSFLWRPRLEFLSSSRKLFRGINIVSYPEKNHYVAGLVVAGVIERNDKQKSEINYEDKETCLIWWCSWSERRDEYPREILPHQHQALTPK